MNPLVNKRCSPIEEMIYQDGFQAGAASRDAKIKAQQKRIELYELALKASWPEGAIGDAFDYWNAARKEQP